MIFNGKIGAARYRATCSLCHWEDEPRSLEAAHAEQARHADSRTHQLAIVQRDYVDEGVAETRQTDSREAT